MVETKSTNAVHELSCFFRLGGLFLLDLDDMASFEDGSPFVLQHAFHGARWLFPGGGIRLCILGRSSTGRHVVHVLVGGT